MKHTVLTITSDFRTFDSGNKIKYFAKRIGKLLKLEFNIMPYIRVASGHPEKAFLVFEYFLDNCNPGATSLQIFKILPLLKVFFPLFQSINVGKMNLINGFLEKLKGFVMANWLCMSA